MYNRSKEKEAYMSIGFLNLLTIIFIVAKLLGIVKASWIIVFLPTIISAVLTTILVVIALLCALLSGVD